MIEDLQSFISVLRRENEVRDIVAPVDPYLEAAEIHRRVIANGGPALLFHNIVGARFPLVTNLFGTKRRMELAFGSRPEVLMRQLARLPETLLPPTPRALWHNRNLLFSLSHIGLKRNSRAPVLACQQSPARLNELPLLTTWKEDGGAFVTLPLVYTEHPTMGSHNLGMYRLQRFDGETTGFHCQIGKGAGFHLAEAGRVGKKLPVNVYVGGPPALILAAIAPLPENAPELLLASLLLGKRLSLCKNPYGKLPLVAQSEFALIGEVDPEERRPEGPFGDHYGYYSLQHEYPVFHCKAMTHRRNAICAATVVGKPRQEDFFIGDYLQELLSPLFPLVMPAVTDLWSYGETGYHSLATAVVKQRYKREAMASAFRILGEGQLSLTKFLLVIDQSMNIRDFPAVLEHVLARADLRTDLYVFSNLAMDTLDYTGPAVNEGSKGVLLGVGPALRELPRSFMGTLPIGIDHAAPFCGGCLALSGEGRGFDRALAERVACHPAFKDWPLLVLVDDAERASRTSMDFLWTTFTRFEPGADIYAQSKTIERNHISYHGPMVIDARLKPGFPKELRCDEETAQRVDRRWDEYFKQ